MTIVQLEYLLAVVNHGSFSAAAEYCFVTQPTLSMQISNLEDELSVTLFDRTVRPIVPTVIGHIVLEQARDAVAAFYGTKEKVNEHKGNICGKLRLGVIPTISPYLMPGFIPEFERRCPKADLEIHDMYTSDIIDALNRDLIDIGILSGGESVVKIRETDLFDDKLYMYVSPKNKLYKKDVILFEDIDIKKILVLSEGNCLRNQAMRLCKARKNIKLQHDFANSSLETLMNAVNVTDTMTLIPGMSVGFIPEERRRQVKPLGNNGARRTISMAVGRTYVKEALVNLVKESIMTVAKEFELAEFLVP